MILTDPDQQTFGWATGLPYSIIEDALTYRCAATEWGGEVALENLKFPMRLCPRVPGVIFMIMDMEAVPI